MLLVALLHVLNLPPIEVIPAEMGLCQPYLDALDAADHGDYGRLTEMWLRHYEESVPVANMHSRGYC